MSSLIFFFSGKNIMLTNRTYEEAICKQCAESGMEYFTFLARHNQVLPPKKDDNTSSSMQIVISDVVFDDNGQKFITGVGVFRLKITNRYSYTLSRPYNYILVRSKGQLYRNMDDAVNNRAPLAQKTLYARFYYQVQQAPAAYSLSPAQGIIYYDLIYERWR